MYMELKKLSIKNFIGDLPRIINDSFTAIETAFNKIYHEGYIGDEDLSVKCKSIEVTSDEYNNSIVANGDIKIKIDSVNDEPISLITLYHKVEELESRLDGNYSSRLVKKKLQ